MNKHIRTILLYNKDQVPGMLCNPVYYYLFGIIVILVSAVLTANIPNWRPGLLWSPRDIEWLPNILSKLVTLFPVTILLSIVNPSRSLSERFKYHWCGMEMVCTVTPFTSYTDGWTQKLDMERVERLWAFLQGYFSKELDLQVLANNHRRYRIISLGLYWISVISIIISFIYIGYILGINWRRNLQTIEMLQNIFLMRALWVGPVIGIILQYLHHVFVGHNGWRKVNDLEEYDEERAYAYFNKNQNLFRQLRLDKE